MTTAAGVFKVTRFRLWIRQHLVARRSRGQTFKFGQEVIGERLSRARGPDLQFAVQRLRHIPDLDHLGHVASMLACMPVTCRGQAEHGSGPPRAK